MNFEGIRLVTPLILTAIRGQYVYLYNFCFLSEF